MKKILCLIPVLLTLLTACSPKIRSAIISERPPLAYDSEVYVIAENETLPKGTKAIGKLKIGDSGFTLKCTYEIVLEQAKLQARENGANVVKITDHKTPNAFGSSCHRIKGDLYYLADTSVLARYEEEPILADVDYALLYVYRNSGAGALIGYNLQIGDSTISRIKNSYKEVIKIKREGMVELTAKTESKAELPVDLVFGKSYYIRCGLKTGIAVGRPSLELVDYRIGKMEFESLQAKNDASDAGE